MKQALIDTDTLPYYFRRHPGVVIKLDAYLKEFGFINVSVVTYYEVLNGLYYKDAQKQLQRFEQFISINRILPLTQLIAKKSASHFTNLRRQGQIIGHNDRYCISL